MGGGPTSIKVVQALQGSAETAGEESIIRNMESPPLGKYRHEKTTMLSGMSFHRTAALERHFSVASVLCWLW